MCSVQDNIKINKGLAAKVCVVNDMDVMHMIRIVLMCDIYLCVCVSLCMYA